MDDVLAATVGLNKKNGIQWRLYKYLSHLDYADNVCFLSHSSDGLKKMCEKLNNNGEPACLKINVQKKFTRVRFRRSKIHGTLKEKNVSYIFQKQGEY
jgi:hypothetical protein